MSGFFIASYIVLWVLVLVLAYIVIAMVKRMYRTVLPASDQGLHVGADFPLPRTGTFAKQAEESGIPAASQEGTLVFFTSSGCQFCKQTYPFIEQFKQKHSKYNYLLIMDADEEEGQEIVRHYGITLPVYFVEDVEPFETPGFPFAYFLTPEARVLSKGIFNRSEDIQHLIASGRKMRRKIA